MNILLIVLLAAFGVAGGFFIGCGNYAGLLWALPPGVLCGLLLAIPMLRERQWVPAAVIVGCALVGSIIASQTPDSNSLKRYAREQKSLTIRVGSFRLGAGDLDGTH